MSVHSDNVPLSQQLTLADLDDDIEEDDGLAGFVDDPTLSVEEMAAKNFIAQTRKE